MEERSTEQTTQQYTDILAHLAERATARYPTRSKSIAKALILAQESRVILVGKCQAYVESATYPGQYYRVQGKTCSCPARVEEAAIGKCCAHRFAVALVRHAQSEQSLPLAPIVRETYYAELLTADGPVLGEATHTGRDWTFTPTGAMTGQVVNLTHLTLRGNVDVSQQQRHVDGNLIERVMHRFDYGNGQ